ncbi:putative methyltransferase-domain-containing protein [Pelagophyceae sp. CCMP2097]|nr:putative methyltransferase-domain-containing protein [Pelagophyceae sp. CCMP2097]
MMADFADDEDDEPAIGYMFDSHAPSEFQTFECPRRGGGVLRVDYACQRDQDCSTTADQSGHSVWPAAKQLAEYVALNVEVQGKTVVELGCGIGLVGLACVHLGAACVTFTDRDPGTLKLVESALSRNPAAAGGAKCERLRWSEGFFDEAPRYDLVVAADVVYDPGVVAPLVATAARRLALMGEMLLAASFELDESLPVLVNECRRRGLKLQMLRRDGPATLWRIARRRQAQSVVADARPFALKARRFFAAAAGGLAIELCTWPDAAAALKAALDVELDGFVGAEAPAAPAAAGDWPTVLLGARRDAFSDRALSPSDYAALHRVLRDASCELLQVELWAVAALNVVVSAAPSLEYLISAHRVELRGGENDARCGGGAKDVDAAVDAVAEADDAEASAFNRPGGASRYTAGAAGASVVAFLRDARGDDAETRGLAAAAAELRRRVEAALPGFFDWFDDDALHCTLRPLTQ